MKSVQIRSFFWSAFSRNRTEYGQISGWSSVDEVGQAGNFSFFSRLRLTQKALQLLFNFFFSFLFTDRSFTQHFMIAPTHSLHTPKCYFRKNTSSSCYSRHVWHMTRLMHGNQHSQHPKNTRNKKETSETSQLASRWEKIQGSKQRQIELIRKKSWKKEEDVQNKKMLKKLLLHVKQYKNCC